jgi:putative transposase
MRKKVQEKYKAFVQEGKGQPSPWESLKNQIYLGSDEFIDDMQCKIDPNQSMKDIPKPQKNSPIKPIIHYKERYQSRNRAMA